MEKEIKEIKVILTEYGLLSDGKTEYSLNSFKKLFKDNMHRVLEFTYDEENMEFVIRVKCKNDIKRYTINLTTNHKEHIAMGIVDKDVETLMNILKEFQRKKRKEEINTEVITTGEYPNNTEDLALYTEYINKALKETNADIVRDYQWITSPIILGAAVYALQQNYTTLPIPEFVSILGIILGGFITFMLTVSVFDTSTNNPGAIVCLKNNLEESKKLYQKLIRLEDKYKELGLLEKGKAIKELPTSENDLPSTMSL